MEEEEKKNREELKGIGRSIERHGKRNRKREIDIG